MAPVNSTIGTSARTYSTFTLFFAAIGGAAGGSGDDAIGTAYNDSTFDENVITADAGANNPDSITVTVAAGERHDGTAGTGVRIVRTATGVVWSWNFISVTCILEWLAIDMNANHTGTSGPTGGAVTNNNTGVMPTHRWVIIHGAAGATFGAGGRCFTNAFARGSTQIRCGGWDMQVTASGSASRSVFYIQEGAAATGSCVNCSWTDITSTTGTSDGIRIVGSGSINIENCLGTNVDGSNYLPTGTPSVTSATNADDDGTTPGLIGSNPVASGVEFVSDSAPYDLHLAVGAESIDAGTDVSGSTPAAATDIDGETVTGTWDVGFDERAAPPAGAVMNQLQGANLGADLYDGTLL